MSKKIFVLFIILIGLALCWSAIASALTQDEYLVKLAEELDLGGNLLLDEAIFLLAGAGIVPKDGFEPDAEITAAFLSEIQDLVLMAAEKGLIRFSSEQVAEILTSLSEDIGLPEPESPLAFTPPPPSSPPSPVSVSPMR